MLKLPFSSKVDWFSFIISITKTASKKIETLINSLNFLSPEVALHLYKNLPYDLACNTVVISGLLLLAATWIC